MYECVWAFLNKADGQEDKAAAVMRLGAAKHFTGHVQPTGYAHIMSHRRAMDGTMSVPSALCFLTA